MRCRVGIGLIGHHHFGNAADDRWPSGATQPGVVGQVVFASGDKREVAEATADGTFAVDLPPGTYTVTGASPLYGDGQGQCRADAPVVVDDTAVTGIVVACSRR